MAHVEDTQRGPDPLLRASRAALRTILEELSREFSSDNIRTAEVRADVQRAVSPEEYAKAVIRALEEPTKPEAEHCTYQI